MAPHTVALFFVVLSSRLRCRGTSCRRASEIPLSYILNFPDVLLSSDHGPTILFKSTASSLAKHGLELVLILTLLGAAVFISRKRWVLSLPKPKLPWVALAITVILVAVFMLVSVLYSGTVHRAVLYFSVLPILILSILGKAHVDRLDTKYSTIDRLTVIVALMFAIPFAISLGTDSPLFWHSLSNMTSLYAGLALAYLALGRLFKNNPIHTRFNNDGLRSVRVGVHRGICSSSSANVRFKTPEHAGRATSRHRWTSRRTQNARLPAGYLRSAGSQRFQDK